MAQIRQLPGAQGQSVGSFADWIASREAEQEALDRILTAEMLTEHRERDRAGVKAPVPSAASQPPRARTNTAARPRAKRAESHVKDTKAPKLDAFARGAAHAEAKGALRRGRQAKAPSARRLSPVAEHRIQRLRPMPTGAELRRERRSALAERVIVLFSVALVAAGALTTVVVRAEIAKMQLRVDNAQPALAKLAKENSLLSVNYQQLSAPARIAAIAQSKLGMVFAPGAGLKASAQPGSTYSAQGQSYSLYYSPSGVTPTPPTTQPPKASAASNKGAKSKGTSKSTATTATTKPGTGQPAASSTKPAATTASTSPPTTSGLTLVTPTGTGGGAG